MLGDVLDGWAFDADGCVVPADAAAGTVIRGVVRVAAVEREVDSADEGDSIVDHDRLFVVAVRERRCTSRARS